MWFHFLTLLGCVLEIPRYITYVLNDTADTYTTSLYPLHLISMSTVFVSFCIIINLWGSAIVFDANNRTMKGRRVKQFLVTVCVLEVVIMAGNSIYLQFITFDEYTHIGNSSAVPYQIMTFYQTIGMVLLSVSFFLFGWIAQRKIWRSYSPSDVQNSWQNDKKFWRGLVRLNVVVVVCVVCFVTKAVLLMMLIRDSTPDMNDTPLSQYGVSIVVWNILYEWIPDIVPR